MSRKKLIYLGMLSIAVTAFLIDRVFLGRPQEAEAEPTAESDRPRPASAAKPAAAKPPVLDPSLAWLEKLTDLGMSRDAFSPKRAWLESKQAKPEIEDPDAGPAPGSPDAFEAAHQLQATTVMGPGSLAVVDQRCLRIGDTLDGFRLTRVGPSRVEFHKGADVATLTLPMSPDAVLPANGAPMDKVRTQPTPSSSTTRPAAGWNRLLELLIQPRSRR